MSVYPEEYEMLKSSIKKYGYKRADFVLACVNTVSRGSLEKAHKKIVKMHKTMLLEKFGFRTIPARLYPCVLRRGKVTQFI